MQQFLGSTDREVAGVDPRSDVAGGVRQVRQELADLVERVLLVLGHVVDLAALVDVHLVAAELLLGQRLADGPLHDRRP